MDFLGMGWFEIAIVLLVALIVLGPEKLPAYARNIGKFIRQFRKITSGVSKEISRAMDMDDVDEQEDGIKKELKAISKSLEEDAALLRKSLSEEAASIEKVVSESTRDAKESLVKDTSEIARSFSEGAAEAKKEVNEGVSEARKNLGMEEPSSEAVVEYRPPAAPEAESRETVGET
jgi:Tat protein translocase TatB subunit